MKGVVVMGVTGSVAAYRAADVARDLMRAGFEVRVCLSRGAAEFVTATLFEALTGNPALTDAFDEPKPGRMAHIDWARDADVLLVCPASANALARLAAGRSEDMFSTIAVASTAPLVVAPAMNPEMFSHEATQQNLKALRDRGAIVVEPTEGDVACGEHGQGKLAPTQVIVEATLQAAMRSDLYRGTRVVVTAGPTAEPLDPVRILTNRSSGKMGYAIARAAIQMGAEVVLITGPTCLTPPPRADTRRVETASEMLTSALNACQSADLFVAAAAVADFTPKEPRSDKIRRDGDLTVELAPTQDIVATVAEKFPELVVCGFAAEVSEVEAAARAKLEKKGLSAIAANDVSRSDIGFDSDDNEVTVLFRDGSKIEIPRSSKLVVAMRLLEALRPLMAPPGKN
ncbi:MAG: bifunctional phosphopantothenoylcysteine decarboxylase/phosphopantothenate--cysteine ligase CoaBC [Armatimonadetes bacterium]|nr:bifunctional phosphopantothenoylcysteine decarboxylase/phosphopantothenate--cysteine ligase CoaBC [Armatimonadota bacterium]NOG93398.1 bifunctional phosphopantothenoylcysteine decarboxylase/phosphopantothenate--cysteine ligase CoaBC [Armatimonadota bacterium]